MRYCNSWGTGLTKTTLPFPSLLRYLKQFVVLGLSSTHICYSWARHFGPSCAYTYQGDYLLFVCQQRLNLFSFPDLVFQAFIFKPSQKFMTKLQLDTCPQVSAFCPGHHWGAGTDLPVPHRALLTHPLGAFLNMQLPSNPIDKIIQAHHPLEANSFESDQLAGCHLKHKFGGLDCSRLFIKQS